jgi:DNA-binding transcriptional MerR regulator
MKYQIKELAGLAGVSVRTLRYYDQIGLLKASRDLGNDYRVYDEQSVETLQQILFYKELGFDLERTATLISEGMDTRALSEHRKLLELKKERLEKILKLIVSIEKGENIMAEKTIGVFDMSEVDKYREEVMEKYDEKVVKESFSKTGKYSKKDWERIIGEGNEIFGKIAELMHLDPGSSQIQELVEEYRQYIDKSFYTCTMEIFKGLGVIYVTDERFTKNLEKHGKGFAEFLSKAIEAY